MPIEEGQDRVADDQNIGIGKFGGRDFASQRLPCPVEKSGAIGRSREIAIELPVEASAILGTQSFIFQHRKVRN
ncbi:MAG: hypothetical protein H0W74_01460 [Sphingosinicella sp.]|nr:hypothetical protein [Sphingosinicella sp.]